MIAMERWPDAGVPDNPAAWILTTARNRAIDRLRRDRSLAEKRELLRRDAERTQEPDEMDEFPDDRLRLIFTCCHPALAPEARVALTLRALGGLTTPEIARAFLVAEPAMAQRIVRAKRKIREAGIPYVVPEATRAARAPGVGAGGALPRVQRGLRGQLGRRPRAARAVRRGDPPGRRARRADARRGRGAGAAGADDAPGLAPRRARGRGRGGWCCWRTQDRGAVGLGRRSPPGWISAGARWRSRPPGRYALQAAIAAEHARAERPADTDWARIAALYGAPRAACSPRRWCRSTARRRSRWPRGPSAGWS